MSINMVSKEELMIGDLITDLSNLLYSRPYDDFEILELVLDNKLNKRIAQLNESQLANLADKYPEVTDVEVYLFDLINNKKRWCYVWHMPFTPVSLLPEIYQKVLNK